MTDAIIAGRNGIVKRPRYLRRRPTRPLPAPVHGWISLTTARCSPPLLRRDGRRTAAARLLEARPREVLHIAIQRTEAPALSGSGQPLRWPVSACLVVSELHVLKRSDRVPRSSGRSRRALTNHQLSWAQRAIRALRTTCQQRLPVRGSGDRSLEYPQRNLARALDLSNAPADLR
jgi:hypothetical protein